MNEYHIRKMIRAEFKLHDEYTKLKEDVELQNKRMWKTVYDKPDDYYHDKELNKIMKKNSERTYDMYKNWYDDSVKKLKEFETKNEYET